MRYFRDTFYSGFPFRWSLHTNNNWSQVAIHKHKLNINYFRWFKHHINGIPLFGHQSTFYVDFGKDYCGAVFRSIPLNWDWVGKNEFYRKAFTVSPQNTTPNAPISPSPRRNRSRLCCTWMIQTNGEQRRYEYAVYSHCTWSASRPTISYTTTHPFLKPWHL